MELGKDEVSRRLSETEKGGWRNLTTGGVQRGSEREGQGAGGNLVGCARVEKGATERGERSLAVRWETRGWWRTVEFGGIREGGDDRAVRTGDVRTIVEAITDDGGRGKQCHR